MAGDLEPLLLDHTDGRVLEDNNNNINSSEVIHNLVALGQLVTGYLEPLFLDHTDGRVLEETQVKQCKVIPRQCALGRHEG